MRWMFVFVMAGVAGCSVIAADVRAVAEPEAPYGDMLGRADELVGKTVILGGYVLETDAGADETVVLVLQAPLDAFELPGDSDRSEGRFLMVHRGYLDPAVYREGRLVTVAGVVDGIIGGTEECPARCLQIETRDVYLWDENVNQPFWVAAGAYPYAPFGVYGWGPLPPFYYYKYGRYPYSYQVRRRPPRRRPVK